MVNFFSEVLRGMETVSRRRGYHLLVSSMRPGNSDFMAILHATRGRVDGLTIMSAEIALETLPANLPVPLPIVLLNCTTCTRKNSTRKSLTVPGR